MASSTPKATRLATGRKPGSRNRGLIISTYQSQNSFTTKSRSVRVAASNW